MIIIAVTLEVIMGFMEGMQSTYHANGDEDTSNAWDQAAKWTSFSVKIARWIALVTGICAFPTTE